MWRFVEDYRSDTFRAPYTLRFGRAAEHLTKAKLVFKFDTILKKRDLTQVEAASRFGVRRPDVSKMLRGELRQFFRWKGCYEFWRAGSECGHCCEAAPWKQ